MKPKQRDKNMRTHASFFCHQSFCHLLLTALLLAPLAALHAAELKLPSIFSEHMVLQCDQSVPVWGWAGAGEKVTVEFAGQSKTVTASGTGKWMVRLDPLAASGESREMHVRIGGKSEDRVIRDVIVGEVWLGSGQSNLGVEVHKLPDYEQEAATLVNPLLREYFVIQTPSLTTPRDDCPGFWRLVQPGSTQAFSAMGYFFIKDLHRELKTPVAFIHDNWPGVTLAKWLSAEGIASLPRMAADSAQEKQTHHQSIAAMKAWLKETKREDHPVTDLARFTTGPLSADKGWVAVGSRGVIEAPDMPKHGAFWFRKEVVIPPDQRHTPQRLLIAPFAMFEQVYWNGQLIGETGFENFATEKSTRWHYYIPPALMRDGANELAVRVFAPSVAPGFAWSPSIGGTPLPGGWQMKMEYPLPALAGLPPPPKLLTLNVGTGSLFNGMIQPIVPFALRGFLWYQGESNAKSAHAYREELPALIKDWRSHWGAGDFPFYFCQLANYRQKKTLPAESDWAELREAQSMTLAVPSTGMAVLIDVGESGDIHPLQKDVAGQRLAKIALAKTYGRPVAYSGPVYRSMKIEANQIRLTFDHVAGGLVAKELPATYDVMRKTKKTAPLVRNRPNSQLEGFAICGADKQWVWADAKIDGDTVLVWADAVAAPIAVRYAWADNPTCNLYNRADLPASPFRTDDFPSMTQKPSLR